MSEVNDFKSTFVYEDYSIGIRLICTAMTLSLCQRNLFECIYLFMLTYTDPAEYAFHSVEKGANVLKITI